MFPRFQITNSKIEKQLEYHVAHLQILKAKLEIPDSEQLRYEVHKDSSVRTSSTVKPRIVIPPKEKEAAPARTPGSTTATATASQ